MDVTPAIIIGSFITGWLARDWTLGKPEPPPCQCVCSWKGQPSTAPETGNSQLIWALGFLVVLFALVAFSNIALALRVTYQDSQTGANREWQVGVKGKSKGVFSSVKGPAISG